MTVPNQRIAGGQRVTFSSAFQAFLDGRFEAALAACDALSLRDDANRYEVALLRARILLRFGLGAAALEALRECAWTPTSVDQYVTAQMLRGAAHVRLGEAERGEALLVEATLLAQDAHPTIRAELAMHLGIAKFELQRWDEAEALLGSVDAREDIIYAHAVQFMGCVAFMRGNLERAAELFGASLAALATCTRRDRYLEANILQGIASASAELLQTDRWPALEHRIRAFDWTRDGLAQPRFWISMFASVLSEAAGDPGAARTWAREAEVSAANAAYRVLAQCRIAAIFRGLRENGAHREFVERAKELYATITVAQLTPDQKQLSLFLAEEMALGGMHEEALALIDHYRTEVIPTVSRPGDERHVALELAVEGYVREASGDNKAAIRLLTEAYRLQRKQGARRRSAHLALHLARLTGAKRYADFAAKAIAGVAPSYWMSLQLAEIGASDGPNLTETEKAILAHLVRGSAYKEIAAARRISWKTVSNHVQMLFRKFEVNSRGQLAAEAIRRGLVGLHDDIESRRA
jgi:DNA-binding NarL/FixJ family response regulator